MIVHGTTDERLEQIKANPKLMAELRHYFGPAGLREQLAEHTARANKAEAQIAVLTEELKLMNLKRESAHLESNLQRRRQSVYGPKYRGLNASELENVARQLNRRL